MNPRRLVLAIVLSAFPVIHASEAPAGGDGDARRNVILIISDDLNRRIAPLGDPDAITPNLTRLSERSLTYRNCVCQYSLCGPSRASFLTGIHPWNLGVHQAGGSQAGAEETVPGRMWMSEYFRSHGYWAGSYGKVEHDENYDKWDELVPRQGGAITGLPTVSGKTFQSYKGLSGDLRFFVWDTHPNDFPDGAATTAALEAIDARVQEGSPFFVALGLYMPHTPWFVPKSIVDQYDPAVLQLPANPPGSYDNAYWPPQAYARGKATDTREWMPEAELREMLLAYYSAVTLMDFHVGRVLDYVDDNGLWENTVIAFVSDNGYSLMEHRHLYSKRNYSRESVHVPLMISHPGISVAGRFCDRQVSLVDLLPTLIDLAGLPTYPKHLDGQSLTPLQEDPDRPWTKPALSALSYPSSSEPRYRIGQLGPWKLIEGPFNPAIRKVMDHVNDPLESYGTFPNGIDPDTLAALEDALAEIPLEPGVFYTSRPEVGPDRDGDGVSDEREIDLLPFGFSPYLDDSERLRNHPPALSLTAGGEVALRWKGLGSGDPVRTDPAHQYPLRLERSTDLESWQLIPEFCLSPDGAVEWLDEGQARAQFYRVGIDP